MPFAFACFALLVLTGCSATPRPLQAFKNYHTQKFANIVQQRQDFSCGAAALATLLTARFDTATVEDDILSWAQTRWDVERISQRGFNLLQLAEYARTQGVSAVGARIGIDVLQALPVPVIVHMNVLGFAHFAVFRGVQSDRIYLADSSFGNITLPVQGFLNIWADAETGTGTIMALASKVSQKTAWESNEDGLRIKPNEDVSRLFDIEDLTHRAHPARELTRAWLM